MNQSVMTLADLKQLLSKLTKKPDDDFKIWLSSDEEGNEFLSMLKDTELCLAIEKDEKKIIFIHRIDKTARHSRSLMTSAYFFHG